MPTGQNQFSGSRSPVITMVTMTAFALAVGIGIGFSWGKRAAKRVGAESPAGTQQARGPSSRTPLPPSVMVTLVGTVETVSSDSFTMEAQRPPFPGTWLAERKVRVDKSTAFVRMQPKDAEQSAKDAEAYVTAQNRHPASGSKRPTPYTETPAKFSEIRTGTLVVVYASPEVHLEDAAEFTATRIETGPPPTTPTNPPKPKG